MAGLRAEECGLSGKGGPNPALTGEVLVTQAPYNAKGDGVTDDSTAIQAAITAVQGTNRVLVIPPGDYIIGTALAVTDDITIRGYGETSTLKNNNNNRVLNWDPAWGSEISVSAVSTQLAGTDAYVTRLTLPLGTVTASLATEYPIKQGEIGKIWSNDQPGYASVMDASDKNWLGENFTVLATSADVSNDFIWLHGKLRAPVATSIKLRMLPPFRCDIQHIAVEANGDIYDNSITARQDSVRIFGARNPNIDIIVKSAWRAGVGLWSCDGGIVHHESRKLHNNPTANAYGYGVYAAGSSRGTELRQANTRAARHGQTTDIQKTTSFSDSNYKSHGVPLAVFIPIARALGGYGAGVDTHEGAISTHYGTVDVSNERRNVDSTITSVGTIKGAGFQDRGEGTIVDNMVVRGTSCGVNLNSQSYPFGRDSVTRIGRLVLEDIDGTGVEVDATAYPNAPGLPYSSSLAINNGAGYAADVQSVNIDGTTGAVTLNVGDHLVIDGHRQRYKVTAANTSSSGAFTAVAISPGLEAAVADNAVVKAHYNQARVHIGKIEARNVGKGEGSVAPVLNMKTNSSAIIDKLDAHDANLVLAFDTVTTGHLSQVEINGGTWSKLGAATTDEVGFVRNMTIATIRNLVIDYTDGLSTRAPFRGKTAGNSRMFVDNLTIIPKSGVLPPAVFYANTSGHNMELYLGRINCIRSTTPLADADSGGTFTRFDWGILPRPDTWPTDAGNAAFTYNASTQGTLVRFNTVITADRACTLAKYLDTVPGSLPPPNSKVRIIRGASATGAFNITVVNGSGGATIATLRAAGMYADCQFDGTDWVLIGLGYISASAAYTVTNRTLDRSYDCDTAVAAEIADVLGTLILDLQAAGIIG